MVPYAIFLDQVDYVPRILVKSLASYKTSRDRVSYHSITTECCKLIPLIDNFRSSTHDVADDLPVGESVVLHGYLGIRKDVSKKLSFVDLVSKDRKNSIQICSAQQEAVSLDQDSRASLKSIPPHSPVVVQGVIQQRKPAQGEIVRQYKRNNKVELYLQDVFPLNYFPTDILMTDNAVHPPEARHLQLRSTPALRDALVFRNDAIATVRDELLAANFVEIETPLLFKSTPEGAREFLVPTREKGMVYALPQSPQQYKQILMASGIPKYFQVARCFRDEDLRADRQPEFTQLDLEISFATGEDVILVIETLLRRLWEKMLSSDISIPFPRMTYHEAMSKFGSDKPDLRLGMEMINVGELLPADLISKIGPYVNPAVDAFKLHVSDNPHETRKFIKTFMDSPEGASFIANPDGQPGIFIYDSRQPLDGLQPFGFQIAEYVEDILNLIDGDLLVLQCRKNGPFFGGSTPAGRLRLALHKAAVAEGLIDPPSGFNFLWVTDFPLFTPNNDTETDTGQGGASGFSSTHHPFTAPKSPEDVALLSTNPLSAIAEHYDIVLNGVELGGGSKRIHSSEFQRYVLKDVLKMSEERMKPFEHLLEVLRAGCPPHAGIALGWDRLVAVMLGKESIRDVIAFPKSGKGEDVLVKAPSRIEEKQLEMYHLRLK